MWSLASGTHHGSHRDGEPNWLRLDPGPAPGESPHLSPGAMESGRPREKVPVLKRAGWALPPPQLVAEGPRRLVLPGRWNTGNGRSRRTRVFQCPSHGRGQRTRGEWAYCASPVRVHPVLCQVAYVQGPDWGRPGDPDCGGGHGGLVAAPSLETPPRPSWPCFQVAIALPAATTKGRLSSCLELAPSPAWPQLPCGPLRHPDLAVHDRLAMSAAGRTGSLCLLT